MAKHKPKVEEEEIADLTPEETAILEGKVVAAAGDTVDGLSGPVRHRIGIFRRMVANYLVRQGVERSVALATIGALGDGKIWDWIMIHGPDIIAFAKMLIAIFALL